MNGEARNAPKHGFRKGAKKLLKRLVHSGGHGHGHQHSAKHKQIQSNNNRDIATDAPSVHPGEEVPNAPPLEKQQEVITVVRPFIKVRVVTWSKSIIPYKSQTETMLIEMGI